MSLAHTIRQSLWLAVALIAIASPCRAESFSFHHEHVLGTSLEIVVESTSTEAARAAEVRILEEIERLAKLYSSYDPASEFSRWERTSGQPVRLSQELLQLLARFDRWQAASRGALNPAAEQLSLTWQQAAQADRLPLGQHLRQAVEQVQSAAWRLDLQDGTAMRSGTCRIGLNAIAKGDIIDRACRRTCESDGRIESLIVNIGGDLRVCGKTHRRVSIVDPLRDAVNAAPLTSIYVSNQAVATSGNYRRGFQVNGKRYSHIIDPRTGDPVDHVRSATVVAETAADADALATILCVLPVDEGLALVQSLPGTECLVLTAEGETETSAGWKALEQPGLFRFAAGNDDRLALAQSAPAENGEDDGQESPELVVEFELNRPSGGNYKRPYVAIWLEDQDRYPVKTAVLWMQTDSPGPRWHRDLLRWYRNDRLRKLTDQTELIGTVSSATRGPGKYKAVFDGTDDAGQPLKPGKYTLFIEAAREHGTYQLIRHEVTLGSELFDAVQLKGNVEVKSASVEYRKPETKTQAERD